MGRVQGQLAGLACRADEGVASLRDHGVGDGAAGTGDVQRVERAGGDRREVASRLRRQGVGGREQDRGGTPGVETGVRTEREGVEWQVGARQVRVVGAEAEVVRAELGERDGGAEAVGAGDPLRAAGAGEVLDLVRDVGADGGDTTGDQDAAGVEVSQPLRRLRVERPVGRGEQDGDPRAGSHRAGDQGVLRHVPAGDDDVVGRQGAVRDQRGRLDAAGATDALQLDGGVLRLDGGHDVLAHGRGLAEHDHVGQGRELVERGPQVGVEAAPVAGRHVGRQQERGPLEAAEQGAREGVELEVRACQDHGVAREVRLEAAALRRDETRGLEAIRAGEADGGDQPVTLQDLDRALE